MANYTIMQLVSRITIFLLVVQFCPVTTLKCYGCASSKDWSSCDDVRRVQTCDSGINHCLKAKVSAKGPLVDHVEYIKLCSNSCDADKLDFCTKKQKGGLKVSCKLYCCKGD